MRAKKEEMISILLSDIDPAAGLPFPVYLHLPRNEKFIPLRHAGDPIGEHKYGALKAKSHFSLWTLKEFCDFIEDGSGASANAITDQSPRKEPAGRGEESKPAPGAAKVNATDLSELPSLVEDVFGDKLLDAQDKAEILSEVGQDVLRVINQITARGEEARAEGFRRSKEVVDKVLEVASQDSDVYSEVLKIWESQEAIFHTAGVGTLSVMFAMCLGYGDERLLADIVVAAVFHDVGKIDIPDIAAKPENGRNPAERLVFQGHVKKSLELLKESKLDFHPRVFKMIAEHHEAYDGSGYPGALKGNELEEISQLLILANYFDGLCSGEEMGTEMSPAEAFDHIYESETSSGGRRLIAPELLQRIFQFMEKEHETSAGFLNNGREMAVEAIERVNRK